MLHAAYTLTLLSLVFAFFSLPIFVVAIMAGLRCKHGHRPLLRTILFGMGICGVVFHGVCLTNSLTNSSKPILLHTDRIDTGLFTGTPTLAVMGLGVFAGLLFVTLVVYGVAAVWRVAFQTLICLLQKEREALPMLGDK